MTWSREEIEAHLDRLLEATTTNHQSAASAVVDELIARLYQTETPFPVSDAGVFLRTLRRKRYFPAMSRLADALVRCGQRAPVVRRQYAQSLIDQGFVTAAIAVLHELVAETRPDGSAPDAAEYAEACGLLGRAHKQVYVDGGHPDVPRNREHLVKAIREYDQIYQLDRTKHLWHGGNVMALLARAARDQAGHEGSPVHGQTFQEVARDLMAPVNRLEASGELTAWQAATGAEACLALARYEDARRLLVAHAMNPNVEAFELQGTYRQLTEVWGLGPDDEAGKILLPILQSQLLKRIDGALELLSEDLDAALSAGATNNDERLEKLLGKEGFETLTWFRAGLERATSVGRIEDKVASALGTGFVVRGSDLHKSWGEDLVLVTNAHVIGSDDSAALRPEWAQVRFECCGAEAGVSELGDILFSSPQENFDVTIVRFKDPPPAGPIAVGGFQRPKSDSEQRLYIIGHPGGRNLSFSMYDNRLIDYDDRVLHYRAPTEGGSSGSPVFDRRWGLIGLHHAGLKNMRRLNGKSGTYPANEGVWLDTILRAIGEFVGA